MWQLDAIKYKMLYEKHNAVHTECILFLESIVKHLKMCTKNNGIYTNYLFEQVEQRFGETGPKFGFAIFCYHFVHTYNFIVALVHATDRESDCSRPFRFPWY